LTQSITNLEAQPSALVRNLSDPSFHRQVGAEIAESKSLPWPHVLGLDRKGFLRFEGQANQDYPSMETISKLPSLDGKGWGRAREAEEQHPPSQPPPSKGEEFSGVLR
jgi:hypothetical protein